MQPECRCKGTGAYTVEVALADAVVLDERICLDHGLIHRAPLLDTTTGRVGELMDVALASHRVWLRPIGGGREWSADVGGLRPAREH